ncbi:MAG: Yip1 family protein [Chloroflexota bacterium]
MAVSPDIDQLFQQAQAAIRAGDKVAGRDQLLQVVRLDEQHEEAWLWLSAATEDRNEQVICLENVLTINPHNELARQGLDRLGWDVPPPGEPPDVTQVAERSSFLSSSESEPPDLDQLFKEAVEAIRAGDKAAGRAKMMRVVQQDEMNEQAWLWLSSVVETDKERVIALENALTVNPDNDKARRMLEKIEARSESAPGVPRPASPPPLQTPTIAAGHLSSQSIANPPVPATSAGDGGSSLSRPSTASQVAAGQDESWRTSPPTPPSGNGGATLVAEPVQAPDRNILDLFDAWAAALIFKVRGTYEEEVSAANVGHSLLSLLFAGLISGVVMLLSVNVVLAPLGGVEGLLAEFERELALQGAPLDPESLAAMGSMFTTMGIVLPFIAAIGMVIGRLFYGIAVHVAARALGGEGELLQTVSAISIASVALAVLNLIPTIAGIGGVLTGSNLDSLLRIYQGTGLIVSLARLGIDGVAVTAAHRNFGVFKGILVIILSAILLGVASCCLIFAFTLLGGGQ